MKDFAAMPVADVRRSLGVEVATRRALIGGVLPLWLGAGLADWYRHRRTRIEQTAGARESAIHLLMMGEPRRPVTPVEQHLHSLLEIVPLMATGFLTVLHWDQARALLGHGARRPRFALRRKRRDPLSGRAKARLIAALLVLGALPYGEELWRCLRTRPTLGKAPEPPSPPPRY